MKHSLLIAAAATALMAAPTIASAQDSGVYIKGQAGYGVFNDADVVPRDSQFSGLLGSINGEGNLALGLGLIGVLPLGYVSPIETVALVAAILLIAHGLALRHFLRP